MQELVTWFQGRPKWLQEAARLLLANSRLSEDDIVKLKSQCVLEAAGNDMAEVAPFPVDAFIAEGVTPLRLCSIGNLNGINALSPRKPLNLGPDNLVVIYGGNGSGKSSYVRLLKHVCGARNLGKLHPNVYSVDETPQTAVITYRVGEEEVQCPWDINDGVHADLRHIDIFDTECGRMYLENESEVTYEPPVLLFFSDLVFACEQVTRLLEDEMDKLISGLPHIPVEYSDTVSGRWYKGLSVSTLPDEVATKAGWNQEDDKALSALEMRLAEKAPAERAKELQAKKKHMVDLHEWIEPLIQQLSEDSCRHILQLKQQKIIKQQAAQIAASAAFTDSPLDGVGSDIWKQLWDCARQYSQSYAYPELAFPNLASDAKCVLCQQALSDDAKKRLTSFEDFVKGQAEIDANDAEKAFNDAISGISEIPSDQQVKTKYDAGGVAYEGDIPPIVESIQLLRDRKAMLLQAEPIDILPSLPDLSTWLTQIRRIAEEYSDAAIRCEGDALSDVRPQLNDELLELKARKWISGQMGAIKAEIQRLQSLEQLGAAKRLADTRGLSRKKGELSESLITEAFVQRFRTELHVLGASRIRVRLSKKRVDRGRVLHELRLEQAQTGVPREVLSEGEHRIVSLAAFLADVTGKLHPTPFVFDDPISSLDQSFEEAVVQRLVRLAADRQVIVFTHRVSLLVLLQDYGKKEERDPKVTCVRNEVWGAGEPGDTPLFAKKPDKALNTLLNDSLAKARNVLHEEGQSSYHLLAKAICSDFRIVLERMIEADLLADVVQRFRRAITTQGKLEKLPRITPEDCKLFDDMMTKYSRYEHSQPNEAPVVMPDPQELKEDMEALRDWRSSFIARECLPRS
jgi:energy-coupling factor transporter ATP-binding protein EcfA2